MFIIYKKLIEKYIGLLTPNHIQDYAKSLNISISDEETDIIYHFILNNYQNLLEDDTTIFLLKELIRNDLYEEIFSLYTENKAKYL